MFQLGQLHLQLAFAGAGVAGEDVQDELGPVEDAAVEIVRDYHAYRYFAEPQAFAARESLRSTAPSQFFSRLTSWFSRSSSRSQKLKIT